MLHVSAAHFSHHRVGYRFSKRVKGERPLLTNNRYEVIVKFLIIIIPKTEL